MKTKYFFSLIAVAAFAFAATGCDDADYGIQDNSVYLADAAQSTVIARNVTLDNINGLDLNIIVRLARLVDHDVTVEIKTNPDFLEEYNEKNFTDYVFNPSVAIPAGTTITIPAGEISGSYVHHIDPFDTEGKKFCVPIEMGEVLEGDIPRSYAQNRYIYVLASPLYISVPHFKGLNGHVGCSPVDEKWGVVTAQWSMEFWCNMSGYNNNNQAVVSMGSQGQEVAYIRFGDANRPYNYVQIKSLGGQVDGPRDLQVDTWYHWAFVYDGEELTIYRDGDRVTSFNPPAPEGGTCKIDEVFLVCGWSYFVDTVMMCEVRLWKTAISQTQIQNNMIYAQDPSNPNLIAYWPMSEGSGREFADKTGNGHDAYCINSGSADVLIGWVHNVNFGK